MQINTETLELKRTRFQGRSPSILYSEAYFCNFPNWFKLNKIIELILLNFKLFQILILRVCYGVVYLVYIGALDRPFERWFVGLLVCFSVGSLVHWIVLTRKMFPIFYETPSNQPTTCTKYSNIPLSTGTNETKRETKCKTKQYEWNNRKHGTK